MKRAKTIVIWGCEDILSASIEDFLAAVEGWNVISISCKEELDTLLLAENAAVPDIVIINQAFNCIPSNFLLKLLHDYPAIKVITIGLDNNLMEIYSKQKILVKQASDLIGIIENAL